MIKSHAHLKRILNFELAYIKTTDLQIEQKRNEQLKQIFQECMSNCKKTSGSRYDFLSY